ncbi:MAG: hypothetical protein AAFW89_11460 [Bacteroidota bacterium]
MVFLLPFISSCYAQEHLSLRTLPFSPSTPEPVFVERVMDDRLIKSLGVHKNLTNNDVELFLAGGAEQSVQDFFNTSLPEKEGGIPIVISIRALNVQESVRRMNRGITSVARTHLSLVFYEMRSDSLKELYRIKHNEDAVFELGDREAIYATHEKRIRAALEYCMHSFLNTYHQVKATLNDSDFRPLSQNERIDIRLGDWYNLVTLKAIRSRYLEGYGISYTGFVDNSKGLIRPYETSFEIAWARPDVAEDNGFNHVNSFVFRPELYFFYKKLFQGTYASMSANVPVGFELLEDLEGKNSVNFVIGVGASQGLRFIPWRKKGIVFGADVLQQLETSKVYRFDLGIELVLGFNF